MKKIAWPIPLLMAAILATLAPAIKAGSDDETRAAIDAREKDFWKTYNACDSDHFKDFFTEDVEFYHDKGGITTGLSALVESLKKNLCGGSVRLRRELVEATMKVSILKKEREIYGAIVSGEHVFYVRPENEAEFLDGRANFTTLWLKKGDVFKMARILSYDHRPAKENGKK